MERGSRQVLRVWTDPRLLAWNGLQLLISPYLIVKKLKRHFVKHREWEFDLRRWQVPVLTPNVPPARVVFVGAGPGELTMIDRLVESIQARRPDLTLGICLRAIDTLLALRTERPGRRLSIWPFDVLPPVARWLRSERPELLVFVDHSFYTTLACGAVRSGAGLAIVNGRSRPARRARFRDRLRLPVQRWQFKGARLMGMIGSEGANRVRPLVPGGCEIVETGSLKADLRRRELPETTRLDLEAWLLPDEVPLVAVGSTTDPEEEAMVLDAFIATRAQTPCRLLMAPRDVRRCGSTRELIAGRGLSLSRRSAREGIADILLLDTFGELATAYSSCWAAYVGGFWCGGGGHNVLEPLAAAIPVAYGPKPGSFDAERRIAESAGAGFPVDGADELSAFWLRFLRDDAERERIGLAGKRVLDENRGAVERTVDALLGVLDG